MAEAPLVGLVLLAEPPGQHHELGAGRLGQLRQQGGLGAGFAAVQRTQEVAHLSLTQACVGKHLIALGITQACETPGTLYENCLEHVSR